MKKLLVLLGIITITPCISYAFINESETSNIDVLRHQGYSESTLEVVDTAKYYNGGISKKNQRYFKTKEHRHLGKGYKYLKQYVDPAQDDGIFGEHQINFSNNWNGDVTKYTSEKVQSNQVDNL